MKFPYTGLVLGPHRSVAVAGPHIHVVDSKNGDSIHPPTGKDLIRYFAVDQAFKYIVTVADDKKLKVWELDSLTVLSSREIPKKATGLRFVQNDEVIIVADKFGDIFSYPLHPPPPSPPPQEDPTSNRRESLTSHDNKAGGSLILGHTSIITTFLLTKDEQYVITADRDEHVRVSCFPEGWNIERFCLGHSKFVSSLHIPSFSPSHLISGGGDEYLNIFTYTSGSLINQIAILSYAQAWIKVKGGRKKWKRSERGRWGRNREREREGEGEGEDVEMEEEDSFVVKKIESFEWMDERWLIYSAVGSTAIFYTPFPDLSAPSPAPPSPPPKHFDFKKPVLEYYIHPSPEGQIELWALIDANWTFNEEGGENENENRLVRRLIYTDGEFIEPTSQNSLLEALNSRLPVEASPSDLSELDLYVDLVALPKGRQPEQGEGEGEGEGDADGEDDQSEDDGSTPTFVLLAQEEETAKTKKGKKGLSKREGRMKTKVELMRKMSGLAWRETETGTGSEREVKKVRLVGSDET